MRDVTFLLVHGAWSGAWCWSLLGEEFERRDVMFETVDLPSSTPHAHAETYLIDDARDVAELANESGPVVLVGHSYAGCVITEAAPLVNDLRALIYVAALLPLVGESASDASRAAGVRTALDEAIYVDGERTYLRPEIAKGALYQDCEEALANWAVERLTSQTLASFRSPRGSGDVAAPRRYILCEEDMAIDPQTQAIMASRCGEVVTMASGHSPFLSRPATLADLILAPFES